MMDPSSWVNYTAAQHYQRLRGNHHQMNVHPNVPGLNVATQGPGQLNMNMNMNMNMNDHHVNLSINSAANQAMSGHYSGTAAHPWLFPHGLNATPSHQPTNHPAEHASNPFNPNPFLHHPASYDASTFLSGTFPSAAAKAGYIQTATGFFNPMKKADMQMTNDMSNLNMRGATFPGHCTTMNLPGMGPGPPINNINNMSADPNSSITTGNIFSSHLGPTSWRHHPNLMSSNTSSGPFGVLPHESVNIMNTGAPTSHHSHQTTHSSNSHSKSSSDKHHHHHHKQSSAAMANAADNSFRSMIPSLPSASQSAHSNRNSHQSFDHTTSSNSKLSHHHHGQTDPYNLAAAAAAAAMNHAMNTEYASMQQSRYAGMSSGNHNHNFTGNSNSRGASYPPVGFNNDPTGRSARELISSNFLHSAKPNTNTNSTCARNMNMMNTSNYLQNCGMMMMNSSANNYSPSPAHSAGNNSVSNNMNHSHSNTSHSRSSSSASNHPLQQGNDSSSCSFGYGSPAATTLPQSPYQQPQRSNTANSSQGTSSNAASSAAVQSAEFTTYGTQVYPSMGTPAPTPTPGYPTPPSSVGQTHVTPQANSQSSSAASSHDDSVSHYPQLTPPTPSSQNNQFVPNYSSTYPSTPKLSNNSRTPESILPNTSSCMVAAAAANMNVNVNNVNAVNQRSSAGYMIGSEQETCLSNIVNVNSLSDPDKLSNASLSSSSANVIGHPNEPTLNSVFAPQDIDFPSISFPTNDDTHSYGGNSVDKMNEQNSYHKKKAKKEKKAKKKDKNKAVGVGVGISLDSSTAYPNYYPQYQNSYSSLQQTNDPYNIMQQQNIQHSSSQQTHNTIMPTTNTTEASATACYDLQYQHITEQQRQHDASLQPISHDTLQTQQVQSQQSQHQQLIQPVVSIQSTQQVQSTQSTTTTTSISDKQSFPTIDDDLSFLTEPTPDCVSIQNQNANNSIQVETQTPISSAPTISLNESMEKSNQGATQNSTDGLFSSFMSFIDSSQTQTQTQTQTTDVLSTKEKKKRKHKEIDMKTDVTFNGQKSNKKAKTNGKFSEQLTCRENFQETKENSLINQNNYSNNLMECTTTKKTGDKDYESKFFKRRSSAFSSMPLPVNEISKSNETKSNKKRNKKENKNDLQNNFNIKQTPHDEYEFPDSPLTSKKSTKKKRKPSSSDANKKPFEKISTIKKTNSNKKSITLTTSQMPPSSSHPSSTPQLSSSQLPTNDKNKLNTVGCASSSEGFSVAKVSKETKELVPKQSKLDNQRTQVDKSAQEEVKLLQRGQQNQQTQIKKQNQNNNSNNTSNNNKKNHSSVKQSSSNTITTSIITTSTCSTKPMISTNVTSHSTNTNNHSCLSTNSVGMQSAGTNTPRRRSQDKKASAIREGLMRTGDYVIAIEEIAYDLPVIWRIEGKSLLQRFEPSEQDGITVYINTSSYSAWNPTVRQRYTGVDVRVMGHNRARIVVEKLGLTQNNPNSNVNGTATIERVSGYNNKSTPSITSIQLQENFEVFIQTLVSQALDPNFISEIVKENDDYFLSHVQAIDDVCTRKKTRFFSKVKWDANIVKCVETFPVFSVTPQNNVGDLRCRLCHDNWSTQLLQFSGEPYNPMTLEVQNAIDIKQTKYAACDACKDKMILYSNLHHQKVNFYQKCKTKVEAIRGGDENKESHVILEKCLEDTEWITTLFKELEEIWSSCDKIR